MKPTDVLKTEEHKRLLLAAAVSVLFYILLFLTLSVYFYVNRRDTEPFGATAVYLELMQVAQAPVQAAASNPSSSSPTQAAAVKKAAAPSAVKKAEHRSQAQPSIASTVAAEQTAPAQDWNDDFFSDLEFGDSVQAASHSAQSGVSVDTVSGNEVLRDDYSRLDSALNRQTEAEASGNGAFVADKNSAASGLGARESASVVDLDGLTADRKLLSMVDPDFSGVDTAGRSRFSFVISFDLNADGSVSRVFVTESSGSTLADRRMEQALRQWRFASAPGNKTVNVRLKYYVRVQ